MKILVEELWRFCIADLDASASPSIIGCWTQYFLVIIWQQGSRVKTVGRDATLLGQPERFFTSTCQGGKVVPVWISIRQFFLLLPMCWVTLSRGSSDMWPGVQGL